MALMLKLSVYTAGWISVMACWRALLFVQATHYATLHVCFVIQSFSLSFNPQGFFHTLWRRTKSFTGLFVLRKPSNAACREAVERGHSGGNGWEAGLRIYWPRWVPFLRALLMFLEHDLSTSMISESWGCLYWPEGRERELPPTATSYCTSKFEGGG